MKPSGLSVILSEKRHLPTAAARRQGARPLTDYNFQSFDLGRARAGGGNNWEPHPSSLWLSYLEIKREAKGVFIVETIVFSLFAAVTAWGIALSARTLLETLRAFAQL